jgi:putative transposase
MCVAGGVRGINAHSTGMVRVYRYRLYPTRAQDAALRETLERLRELYNAALQHRRDAYRRQGATIRAYSQMREIVGVRLVRPEYAAIHTHLLQDVLTRLDRAYRAFFRRCKSGETPGFPRFKGRGRYRTFTFKDAVNHNGVRLLGTGRVKLAGIGNVKVKLHRPFEGRIKQASVSLDGDGHWYIAVACDEVPVAPLPATGKSVGIDVGLTTFAALSDGTMVDNPRPYESAQRTLATAQRRVSRRKRGSKRRRKAVCLLAKQSARVQRVRLDFHHKTARDVVRTYDAIAVEDLNVKGLARTRLAKQVHDAGWAQFTTILASKAESAGREFYRVDPRGTSQRCSGCDAEVHKGLRVRVHACPYCGLVLDRDVNAARNIAKRPGHGRRGGLSSGRPEEPRSPSLAR